MVKTVSLGSVSSGTMRPEDLIPTFLDALADCVRDTLDGVSRQMAVAALDGDQTALAQLQDWQADNPSVDCHLNAIGTYLDISERMEMEGEDYWEGEEVDWDLNEDLFQALDHFAPAYCHFGSHEGDGSDYGFWVSWDSLEEDAREGTVLKIDSGEEWPDDLDGAEYVLEVSDHGNGTLYDLDHNEVWSCV